MELVNFRVQFDHFNPIKVQRTILLRHFKKKNLNISKKDIGELLSKAYGSKNPSVSTIPYRKMNVDQRRTVQSQIENVILSEHSKSFTPDEWHSIFKELHSVVEDSFYVNLGSLGDKKVGLITDDLNRNLVTLGNANEGDPLLDKMVLDHDFKTPLFIVLDSLMKSQAKHYESAGYSVYDFNNFHIEMDLIGSLKDVDLIAYSIACIERDLNGNGFISEETLDDLHGYLTHLRSKNSDLTALNICREFGYYEFEYAETKELMIFVKEQIVLPMRMNTKKKKTFLDDLRNKKSIVIAASNDSVSKLFFKRLMLTNIRNYLSEVWRDNDIRSNYSYTWYYQNYQEYYLPGFSVVAAQLRSLNMGTIYNLSKEVDESSPEELRMMYANMFATFIFDKAIYHRIAKSEDGNVRHKELKPGNLGVYGQYSVELQSNHLDAMLADYVRPYEIEQLQIVFEIIEAGMGEISLDNLDYKMIQHLSKVYKIDLKSKIERMDELNMLKHNSMQNMIAEMQSDDSKKSEQPYAFALTEQGKFKGQRVVQLKM